MFCCKGLYKLCTCKCKELGFKAVCTFKKSTNPSLTPNHLYLHSWPYAHQPHDQLKAVFDKITKLKETPPHLTTTMPPPLLLLEKMTTMTIIVVGVLTTYHLFIKIAFDKDFPYLTTTKKMMSAAEETMVRDGGYVVLPQKEYQKLYNRQYAKLKTLKKKVDPEEKHETFLEATLKKHYPRIYQDMLKNDYIMTGSSRIESELNNKAMTESEHQRLNLQMTTQLDNVVSGKQKSVKLSNPICFLAQEYIDSIVNESNVSPEKRCLLYAHLHQFPKHIPWYMKDPVMTMTMTQTNNQQQQQQQQQRHLPLSIMKRSQ